MRILSFGHLPISYGGKQTSGASFVIYQLAKHFNELDNIDSFVCATDIYKETDTSYGITYLGWNKSLIVKKCLNIHILHLKYSVGLFILRKFIISHFCHFCLSPCICSSH